MSKATHLLIGVGILVFSTAAVWGQSGPANPGDGGRGDRNRPGQPRAKPGLAVNDPKVLQGYTLLAPMQSNKTYLIDMEGRVVHTWKSDYPPFLVLTCSKTANSCGRRYSGKAECSLAPGPEQVAAFRKSAGTTS